MELDFRFAQESFGEFGEEDYFSDSQDIFDLLSAELTTLENSSSQILIPFVKISPGEVCSVVVK